MSAANEVLAGYVECALWSTTDNATPAGGEPLDANYSREDIDARTLAEFERECAEFVAANAGDLLGLEDEQVGHDFWLTRNGHGAGFWDRGLGARGDRLSDAAKVYGTVDLYVGDDGRIYAMGCEPPRTGPELQGRPACQCGEIIYAHERGPDGTVRCAGNEDDPTRPCSRCGNPLSEHDDPTQACPAWSPEG